MGEKWYDQLEEWLRLDAAGFIGYARRCGCA